MFVFVTATPSNILLVLEYIIQVVNMHTALFAAGFPAVYCTGWKLNGFWTFSDPLRDGVSFSLPPPMALIGLYGNVELAGLKIVLGVGRWDIEAPGPPRVLSRSGGKVADSGDKASGLNLSRAGEYGWSNPKPTGFSSSSGGGVGVRGGAGIGIPDAMMSEIYGKVQLRVMCTPSVI